MDTLTVPYKGKAMGKIRLLYSFGEDKYIGPVKGVGVVLVHLLIDKHR